MRVPSLSSSPVWTTSVLQQTLWAAETFRKIFMSHYCTLPGPLSHHGDFLCVAASLSNLCCVELCRGMMDGELTSAIVLMFCPSWTGKVLNVETHNSTGLRHGQMSAPGTESPIRKHQYMVIISLIIRLCLTSVWGMYISESLFVYLVIISGWLPRLWHLI